MSLYIYTYTYTCIYIHVKNSFVRLFATFERINQHLENEAILRYISKTVYLNMYI